MNKVTNFLAKLNFNKITHFLDSLKLFMHEVLYLY